MKKSERIAKFQFVADSLGGIDEISDSKFFYLLNEYDLEPEDVGYSTKIDGMEKEDLLKVREKLRKSYISMLMSKEYNMPASSRSQAQIKWLDVYVAFNSAFDLHDMEEDD